MSECKVSELFKGAGVLGWGEQSADWRKAGLVEFQSSAGGSLMVEVDEDGAVVRFVSRISVELLEKLLAPSGIRPASFVSFQKGVALYVSSEV